ncbi:MAG TPA: 50S ribosomal protein L20 [Candidatus Dojkabacteria bacterium]|nr:50S ribosomal protein L20 [Candidatus Dojkabacteria bacterium]HQF36222.1 50S ribosomal protein L20 [Candidatus Dojkabacteria bacterium]
MRVKGGIVTRRRHKKVLNATKGYRMTKNRLYKVAHEAFMHAGVYSFRDRHHRSAQFRKIWIVRLSGVLKEKGISYSKFIKMASDSKVILNRKILSELAIHQPEVFDKVFEVISGNNNTNLNSPKEAS